MLLKPWKNAWISVLGFIGFIIVVVTIVEAQRVSTMPYPAEDFATDTAYKVLRIIDGDTVELNYNGKPTVFRLIGIDTPEIVHPGKPVQPFAKEASEFTSNLLLGESVYLRFGAEEMDKYDRRLAYLYRAPDGLFVNLEIVRLRICLYALSVQAHGTVSSLWKSSARDEERAVWNRCPCAAGFIPCDRHRIKGPSLCDAHRREISSGRLPMVK